MRLSTQTFLSRAIQRSLQVLQNFKQLSLFFRRESGSTIYCASVVCVHTTASSHRRRAQLRVYSSVIRRSERFQFSHDFQHSVSVFFASAFALRASHFVRAFFPAVNLAYALVVRVDECLLRFQFLFLSLFSLKQPVETVYSTRPQSVLVFFAADFIEQLVPRPLVDVLNFYFLSWILRDVVKKCFESILRMLRIIRVHDVV